METRRREGLLAFASATAAVLLAGAFAYWAANDPMLRNDDDQAVVRLVILLPLTFTVLGWVLLHAACRWDLAWAKLGASILAGVFLTLTYVAMASVGMLLMPAAGALALAAALTPVRR